MKKSINMTSTINQSAIQEEEAANSTRFNTKQTQKATKDFIKENKRILLEKTQKEKEKESARATPKDKRLSQSNLRAKSPLSKSPSFQCLKNAIRPPNKEGNQQNQVNLRTTQRPE